MHPPRAFTLLLLSITAMCAGCDRIREMEAARVDEVDRQQQQITEQSRHEFDVPEEFTGDVEARLDYIAFQRAQLILFTQNDEPVSLIVFLGQAQIEFKKLAQEAGTETGKDALNAFSEAMGTQLASLQEIATNAIMDSGDPEISAGQIAVNRLFDGGVAYFTNNKAARNANELAKQVEAMHEERLGGDFPLVEAGFANKDRVWLDDDNWEETYWKKAGTQEQLDEMGIDDQSDAGMPVEAWDFGGTKNDDQGSGWTW